MSLRWRGKKYNNELVCGAKSKPKENDTYIGDRLHYKLAEVYFKAELNTKNEDHVFFATLNCIIKPIVYSLSKN